MQARSLSRIALEALAVFLISTPMAQAQSAATPGSRVPLYFEENQGQTAGEVRFLARAHGYTAYLTGREAVLQYRSRKPGERGINQAVVRLRLAGSQSPSSISGAGLLPGIVNYLIGNDPSKWHTHIPTYSEVDYESVYPGIDLAYRSSGPQLEFDLRVAPGADPNQIQLAYSGAFGMHMNAAGDLVLDTPAGPATIFKPVVYQEIDQKRVLVAADYRVMQNGRVGFQLGQYDHSRELVVDPTIGPSAVYSTYLGSGDYDTVSSIAVDSAGEAFICGTTTSSSFPVTTGAYRTTFPTNNSGTVGFVTALNAAGTGIKYSTYISGTSTNTSISNNGQPSAIAVDATGFAFVGGQTDDPTFPIVKAFQSSIPALSGAPSNYDHTVGIVFELSQNGSSLVYSSFLGGGDPSNSVNAIAVDGSDNAYVTGNVSVYSNGGAGSHSTNFPVTTGVIWGHYNQPDIGAGFDDAFAAKIAPPTTGNSTLSYSTVIGSASAEVPITYGTAIAVDSSGNAYVTGTSNGNVGDHGGTITTKYNMTNLTPGAGGEYVNSVWVLELNTGATAAVYLDYLGGNSPGGMYSPSTGVAGIKVDSSGAAYVAGTTQASNFQTTTGAYQTTRRLAGVTSDANSGNVIQSDGFVTVIVPGGNGLQYSTYLNGTTVSALADSYGYDGSLGVAGIALGTGGQFAVAGLADTTNFPVLVPTTPQGIPLLNAYPGCPGACASSIGFITKFNSSGGLVYSTLVGAGNENTVNAIASNGTDMYVLVSEPNDGLATPGAYDNNNSSGAKELVVRVQDAPAGGSTSPTTTALSDSRSGSSTYGQNVTFTATVTSGGSPVTAGTVTFTDTTTSSTLASGLTLNASGQAAVTVSVLTAGSHSISAAYTPDSSHTSSSASESFAVGKATLTITASSTTMTYGSTPPSVTPSYSAFQNGDTASSLTTAPTCTTTATSATPVGTDTGANTCSGAVDTNYTIGYVAGNVTVTKANTTTAVTASTNPTVFGQSVTFTATVAAVAPGSGTRTGTVTFLDGGTSIGTGTLSAGVATFTTSALSASSHTITASYAGDTNFNSSTGSLTGNPQVVTKASSTTAVTASPNPSVFGQSVTFTATVSPVAPGAGTATGTVTFLDGGSSIGTGTLSGGVATFTSSALAVGNHTITTSYGGDGNFNGSTGSLTGNPQVVHKAGSSTALTSSANPSVFGQSATFTATVSAAAPGTGTPTGTVTFLDGGSPIGTGTLSGGVATFSSSALAVGSHTITTSFGGDGNFNGSTGSLTGNPQVVNKASTTTALTSSLNPTVFGQSVTFTATVSAAAPGAGTATGTVTFLDGGSPIGTGTLSGGVATFATSALASGSHTITTSYGGNANFNGSTGSLTGNPQVVNKANSTTAVTNSLSPTVFGQSVTFTATATAVAPGAGTPTGTVTFLDGGSPIGTGTLSGGVASFSTAALSGGNHTITASYGGDSSFNGSTGSLTGNPQVVNKASSTTAVTASPNPAVFGQPVTYTATVSVVAPGAGTPTGTVTFLDGGTPIGTGTLSGGVATFTTSTLSAGSHTITISYGGDINFNGNTGSLTGNPQVVNKASSTTAVAAAPNPSVFGQSVTFTATVSAVAPGAGTATGTVTFLDGGTSIGTGTLTGGVATLTTTALAVGNHTITTSYAGDTNFNSSTGSLTGNPQVINKAGTTAAVTASPNPAAFGQSVTFTATASAVAPGSGTPTGTVTFLDGGTPIGTGTLTGGVATLTISALAAGSHTITISYAGDGNFNAATGSLTGNPQVVNKANTSTALTSSLNPSVFGQSATFTATVTAVAPGSRTPTGTVTFLDGGTPIGTGTLSGGVATFATSALASGNHTITTNYGGNSSFNASTGTLTGNPQVVAKASSTTAVTSSPNPTVFGQPVTFTATVSAVAPATGTPTGTVTFLDGGTPIGTGTLTGGVATFTASALSAGSHTITISYAGDSSFNGNTASLTGNPQVVSKAGTTTAATSSPNPSVFGQSVTFTATVSPVAPATGTPTGTVTFLDGGSPIGTGTLSEGVATLSIAALAVGNHTITTSYAGDISFNSGTGSLTGNPQVVNKASASLAPTSSPNPAVLGQPVIFTVRVSAVAPATGTPTGTVTVLDNGSPVGTGTLSGGVATITISALAVGSHTITTTYSGDGSFNSITNGASGALAGNPQIVDKANSSTAVISSANPLVFAQSVTFTATVSAAAPGSGTPTGTVTFLDGGSPIGTGNLAGGMATFATSALAAGSHTITTNYGGDADFNGSAGSLTGNPQIVNKAGTSTALTASVNPAVFGQSVTFTATVTSGGTPISTGTVTFTDTTTSATLAAGVALNSNGQATASLSTLAAGSHSISATYNPDGNHSTSAGTDAFSVSQATLTVTASNTSMTYGGTAPAVTPSYSGFVGTDTMESLSTPATCTSTATSATPAGTDTGANTCSGAVDPNYTIAYVAGNVTVGKASLTVTANNTTMTYGSTPPAVPPSYSAFAGADTVASLTTPPACSTTATNSTPVGTDTGANTCMGAVDPNYNIAYVPGNVTIGKAALTITAGNTTMTYGATPPAVTPLYSPFAGIDTVASLTTPPACATTATISTPVGTDEGANTCTGAVDPNYTITYVPGNVTVGRAMLTITASSTTMIHGGTPPAVTPIYSGFTGSDTAASLTTPPTCSTTATSATPPGTDAGANTCQGAVDSNYTITYVAGNVTVGKATPTISVASSINPVLDLNAVTFTATVASTVSTPTGSVSFYDGTTLLGMGTLTGGVATYTMSSLAIGTHSITAVYSGDSSFASVTSSVVLQSVQDFTLTLNISSGSAITETVAPGGTATYIFQVGPAPGTTFPTAVTLTVSGLPPGATATITPQTLPAGSGVTNVTLVVHVAAQSAALYPSKPLDRGLTLALFGGLLLLPFVVTMRRYAPRSRRFVGVAFLVFVAAGAVLGLAGCGGGGTGQGYFGQQVQNYTLTVTATSGALSHNASVNLVVK